MSKHYGNPPIIEAVCEFKLTQDSSWDLTIPGIMYENLADEFPKRERHLLQEVETKKVEEGVQQQLRTTERVRFLSEDTKAFFQIGPYVLAVHCLKPYPTWAVFRAMIEKGFSVLGAVGDIGGLQRIGLRYINRVEIPGQRVELDDYFEFRPFLGERLPQDMNTFLVGCVLPFSEQRDLCKVQLADAVLENQETSAFMLDLDYFLAKPNSVSVDNALLWVDQAHERVEEVFEACITPALRALFGEDR